MTVSSLLSYYPEPFTQRFPAVWTPHPERVRADLYRVELPNGDIWWLEATSEAAVVKQAKALWGLTLSDAIGGEVQ